MKVPDVHSQVEKNPLANLASGLFGEWILTFTRQAIFFTRQSSLFRHRWFRPWELGTNRHQEPEVNEDYYMS